MPRPPDDVDHEGYYVKDWEDANPPEVFTPKAPAIEGLMESVAGRKREAGHCVLESVIPDQEHSLEFRTDLDRKEYSISGMCQTCQDEVFGSDEEE